MASSFPDVHEVLRVAARNPTLKEAARDLNVQYQTLKNYLSAFYQENGYSGLHQALYYELIEPREVNQ